jgi:hypothetical protein
MSNSSNFAVHFVHHMKAWIKNIYDYANGKIATPYLFTWQQESCHQLNILHPCTREKVDGLCVGLCPLKKQ